MHDTSAFKPLYCESCMAILGTKLTIRTSRAGFRIRMSEGTNPKVERRSEAMPDLIVSVSHRLSQDEALRRIQTVVAQAKTQYSDKIDDLQESWNGYVGAFQISAQNQKVSGT